MVLHWQAGRGDQHRRLTTLDPQQLALYSMVSVPDIEQVFTNHQLIICQLGILS
jgi:hypothetical protein